MYILPLGHARVEVDLADHLAEDLHSGLEVLADALGVAVGVGEALDVDVEVDEGAQDPRVHDLDLLDVRAPPVAGPQEPHVRVRPLLRLVHQRHDLRRERPLGQARRHLPHEPLRLRPVALPVVRPHHAQLHARYESLLDVGIAAGGNATTTVASAVAPTIFAGALGFREEVLQLRPRGVRREQPARHARIGSVDDHVRHVAAVGTEGLLDGSEAGLEEVGGAGLHAGGAHAAHGIQEAAVGVRGRVLDDAGEVAGVAQEAAGELRVGPGGAEHEGVRRDEQPGCVAQQQALVPVEADLQDAEGRRRPPLQQHRRDGRQAVPLRQLGAGREHPRRSVELRAPEAELPGPDRVVVYDADAFLGEP